MSDTRVKRTYNLAEGTVRAVRELADRGYATSQDALVERAVQELAWKIQDEEESRLWEAAAQDREFIAEMESIDRALGPLEELPPE